MRLSRNTVRRARCTRLAAGVAFFLLFPPVAALAQEAAPTSSSPRTTLAPPVEPANPSGQQLDPDDERGIDAATLGEELRRFTAITEAEVNAADPGFRQWVDLIRTGRANKTIMRLYWYYRTRLDPFDKLVPAGWREKGFAALQDKERTARGLATFAQSRQQSSQGSASEATLGGPGIDPYGVWVPIGPYTIPGRTTGLDRPEGEPNTLYASVADGGVWRTRDGAATWEMLTPDSPTNSGGAILLDPVNSGVIYFGSGEGNGAIDNYPGVGVLKSTDDGRTWTSSNHFSSSVRRLAMHRSNPNRIYAAGDSGCYVSQDAGATFNLLSGVGLPTNAGASDVLVRPDNANVVFCAIWGGSEGGIYRSSDGGTSFQFLSNGLPGKGTVGRISLAVSKSNPAILLAGIDQSSGTIYKTVNGGDSWASLAGGSVGYCGGQCWYDNVVGIDSADPNVMYAGGVGLKRSLDGGATWANSDSGVHVDYHFILTPAPGEVIVANDGGIYRSTNQAGSWANWGLGMNTTQYYGICRHPSDPDWAMGGTQDNGSHRRRLTDNPAWRQILGADGGMCMTGPPTSQILLGEYQNHDLQRSADGGASFAPARGGIGSNDPRPWVGIMVADPSDRNNMWTSSNRIYRSLDARATAWVSVSIPLYYSLTATALEVAPSNSNVVYAGFDAGGLFVTTNALASPVSWTNIRQGYLPQRGVRRIRVNPTTPDTVYAVFAGYGAGKIWKSVNRGTSWTEVTGDLPDVPVNDLVIDADSPGTLVAATDLGVFRSDNDGANWYGFSAGLPTVSSIELTYDRDSGRLRLGTHGRSMWDWQEASTTPTAVPDGSLVPGRPLTVEKLSPGAMRVRWDSLACTSRDYNLYFGDLAQVASYTYSGASCALGTSGVADVPIPETASGSAFFVIAGTDRQGNEGPHGFSAQGVPTPATGIGYCGITNQVATASCP